MSTFTVNPGDILVYSIKKNNVSYDLVITVKNYTNTINFDYAIAEQSYKGNLVIPATAVTNAVKYDTTLTPAKTELTDETILWLSKKNFLDIAADNQTKMDMGTGPETFNRTKGGILKINYKGKEKLITVYTVENENPADKKSFLVMNEEKNPLIVKMDFGWTITLKEVR
jgi:hypothetical protein